METNKVILLGGSHYHGLNLARCFGEKGIKPYGIIIGKHSVKFVEASKYWEKTYTVETDEEAIRLLIEKFGREKLKPVVIPWSDGATAELDRNYNRLKNAFHLASIKGLEGEIGKWMNKDNQLEFARQLGLPMSPTKIITIPLIDAEIVELKRAISLPLFLKPVTSCEGTKKDMKKIETWAELEQYSLILAQKGFNRILVQEYLNISMEYDFMGVCSDKIKTYSVAEKLRSWPTNGGAASFAKVINVKDEAVFFENIITKLKEFGYSGPFDMDIFLVGNDMYFNEVNWRSSANVYAALKSGNNYPYKWFLAITKQDGQKELSSKNAGSDIYFMNEIWDFKHVISKDITLCQWLSDLKKTIIFAFWDGKDKKPFFAEIIGVLRNQL